MRDILAGLAGAAGGVAFVSALWRRDRRGRQRQTARVHRALVDLLLNAISAGDPVTERHSRRVAELTDVVAATYGISGGEHSTLRLAALLHDMGKIDDRFFHILHSCEPLSPEDREKIHEHPHEGADMLEPLDQIHPGISATVKAHHECWDGNGYPDGLQGEEIPVGARIISVADVFDAMTQPRLYRDPLSPEDALAEIENGAGSRFDPAVVARVREPEVFARWREIAAAGRAAEGELQKKT